jgi:hypothetical protein
MKLAYSFFFINGLAFASGAAPSLRGSERLVVQPDRVLQTEVKVTGACTLENFLAAYGGAGNEAALQAGLQLSAPATETDVQAKCNDALTTGTMDLSDVVGKGPQFLKNFLDGGSSWNNDQVLNKTDAEGINASYDAYAGSVVFTTPNGGADDAYPGYFSNFFNGDQECRLGAIECCYTSRRGGEEVKDNSEMCALDMTLAKKSNHIKLQSWTVYDAKPEDKTYCTGFAYDADSFDDSVKYNTLFHMAMKTNLVDNGYVQEVPGAPMCGCVEQMPVITNSACVKPVEGYVIQTDNSVRINVSWEDCTVEGQPANLMEYYMSLQKTNMEKFFVQTKIVGDGNCPAAAEKFLNNQFWVPTTTSA